MCINSICAPQKGRSKEKAPTEPAAEETDKNSFVVKRDCLAGMQKLWNTMSFYANNGCSYDGSYGVFSKPNQYSSPHRGQGCRIHIEDDDPSVGRIKAFTDIPSLSPQRQRDLVPECLRSPSVSPVPSGGRVSAPQSPKESRPEFVLPPLTKKEEVMTP